MSSETTATGPGAPRVTVAAVVRRGDGRFLLVEEEVRGRRVLNQPAGHVDPGEQVLDALRRETLEETGWQVEPRALVAIYDWISPTDDAHYLRLTYAADAVGEVHGAVLDHGIIGPRWLSLAELEASAVPARSPLVARSIRDYLAGPLLPLDVVRRPAVAP
jgi:8-oxo-dGTP pyrophosphatase MutT (NUDIX family)